MPQTEPITDGAVLARFVAAQTPEARTQAFEVLVNRYSVLVFGVCQRALCNEQDAHDAAQAAFIALAFEARKLTHDRSVAAWLHCVARRIALNLRKSATRRAQREQEARAMRQQAQQDRQEMARLRAVLDDELAALPGKYRLPVILHHLQGHSIESGAQALALNTGTFATRLSRGCELLRKRLAGHSAMASVLLPGLLTAAVTVPALFAGTAAQAATLALSGQTAAVGPPALLAKDALRNLLWLKVKMAAVAASAVLALSLATVVMSRQAAQAPPVATDVLESIPASMPQVAVVPWSHKAGTVFWELGCQGPKVAMLGGWRNLNVPPEMRFRAAGATELIAAVAAPYGLKVTWLRDGQCALLHSSEPDDEVARVQNDLGSPDASVRAEAAWRGGWLRDLRVIPLLVQAARDADPEVARQAMIGLRQLSWDAVLAWDPQALDLAGQDLSAPNARVRQSAVSALGSVGGPKALELLEKALDDPQQWVCEEAAFALGRVGGGPALALLEKTLAKGVTARSVNHRKAMDLARRTFNRSLSANDLKGVRDALALAIEVSEALDNKGLKDAFARAEKACAEGNQKLLSDPDLAFALEVVFLLQGEEDHGQDEHESLRQQAVRALGYAGGVKALQLLEHALGDQAKDVRKEAAGVLCWMFRPTATSGKGAPPAREGPGAFLTEANRAKLVNALEQNLGDEDGDCARFAACALGRIGGEQVLPWLEKALESGDGTPVHTALPYDPAHVADCVNTRISAALALLSMGGEKALALLAKAPPLPRERLYTGFDPSSFRFPGGVSHYASVRFDAQAALGVPGGANTLLLIEKALPDAGAAARSAFSAALTGGHVENLLDSVEETLLARFARAPADDQRSPDDATLTSNAVLALGDIGGERALALLEKALASDNGDVPYNAAAALGYLGGPRALAILEKRLAGPWDEGLHIQASSALDEIGGTQVLPLLEKELASPDMIVSDRAAAALAHISRARLVAAAEKAFGEEDRSTRLNAVRALGKAGGDQALTLLDKIAADPDDTTRARAATALGEVGGPKVLAVLERILADRIPAVRGEAARALGEVGGEGARALLEKALADPEVRATAAYTLADFGAEQARLLLEKPPAEQARPVRGAVAFALGKAGGARALGLLEKASTDPDALVRRDAAVALGMFGGYRPSEEKGAAATAARDKTLALLARALTDPEVAVRVSAASALGWLYQPGEKALHVLETGATDVDVRVRKQVIWAMGYTLSETALAPLKTALADHDPSVRCAAVRALGQISARPLVAGNGPSPERPNAKQVSGWLMDALQTEEDKDVLKAIVSTLESYARDDSDYGVEVKQVLKNWRSGRNAAGEEF